MNFWPNFFLFFYFFYKKTFLSFKNSENKLQIKKRSTRLSIGQYQQIWASSSNGGPGGRLAPRLPSLIKKMFVRCVIQTTTDCEDWAFLQYVGVRTSPFLKLGNPNKKQKSHNFVIGTGICRQVVSFFLSSRYLSRLNRYDVGLPSHVFGFVRRSVRLNC